MGVAPRTPRDGLPEKESEHPGGQVVCGGWWCTGNEGGGTDEGGAAAADYLSSRPGPGERERGTTHTFGPELSTRTHRPASTGNGVRSPLCCRFTWGLVVVGSFGQQTRV